MMATSLHREHRLLRERWQHLEVGLSLGVLEAPHDRLLKAGKFGVPLEHGPACLGVHILYLDDVDHVAGRRLVECHDGHLHFGCGGSRA